MIRPIASGDLPRLLEIHKENGLPENCMPDLDSKLCVLKLCVEKDDRPVMATALMITSEVYVLVDHTYGTPEERWKIMQELCERLKHDAQQTHTLQDFCSQLKRDNWKTNLSQMTAWIPTDIEPSFAKRLEELGFVSSPWHSWTMKL